MALTRDFKQTIKARADRDPLFRKELLKEGVENLLSGEVETGKAILRDYINATVGFRSVGKAVRKEPKSVMRMFGPSGNPNASHLFEILAYLQEKEGIELHVKALVAAAGKNS